MTQYSNVMYKNTYNTLDLRFSQWWQFSGLKRRAFRKSLTFRRNILSPFLGGSRVSLGRNEIFFPSYPLILSESLSLFHWIYRTSFQTRTGLCKNWFTKTDSLSLPPAAAGFLLTLFFDSKVGGYLFLRKIRLSLKCTASQPRIPYSSFAVFHCYM
jgi:hypothetical protein